MIALFDPAPPVLKWCKMKGEVFVEGSCPFGPDWSREMDTEFPDLARAEAVGYKLYQGGEEFRETVSRIDNSTLSRLSRCLGLLPEYNDMTGKVVRYGLDRAPKARHLLFCDTAFFTDLPSRVSTYALPFQLRKNGIRKYGGNGVGHCWAWRQVRQFLGDRADRVISVYLGNNTNVAAIREGKAIETSIGFTPMEGMPSAVSCGSIDSTIIFQLRSAGFSFEEINRLLTRESGFSGLRGKHCSFADLLREISDPEVAAIRDLYRYRLLKYLGAFISALDGIDAIVFFSEMIEAARSLVVDLCEKLIFLGVSLPDEPIPKGREEFFTRGDSRIQVLGLPYRYWEIMARESVKIGRQGFY